MANTGQNARFGAAAFAGGTAALPDVFPRALGPNCGTYLQEVVSSGLTCNLVDRFQTALAAELGVKHCLGTPGCTPAIFALMAALEFEPGDEILVSPVADYGTVMGILFENYLPVFCDTVPGRMHVTADTLRPRITDRTRAILVVHVTGIPCDMDPIVALARDRRLLLFEDVCQAAFSRYKDRWTGTFGTAAAFSFDSEKTMGSDVGGAVVTDDDALADRLAFMGHSRGAKHMPGFGRVHAEQGLALRMTSGTAAICLGQLEIIHEQVRQRDRTARHFNRLAAEIPGIIPYPIPETCTLYSCWMHGFSIDRRAFRCTPDEFAAHLNRAGLPNAGLGRYYLMPDGIPFLRDYVKTNRWPYSVPPASRQYDYSGDSTPNARAFLDSFIRWFWTEKYTEAHVETICSMIETVAAANRT